MERFIGYIMSVKFTVQEMNEMEKILEDFLRQRNIELKVPVDIFNLAYNIGFDVRGTEFSKSLEGLILVNENVERINGFESNKVIAYNCQSKIFNKKFIVGHELAHYIEEKHKNPNSKIVVAARDHEGGYSQDKEEQRKDYFAAALLMPREDMKKRYKEDEVSQTDEFYNKVAKDYNVVDEMAKRRVFEVFYER